MDERELLTTAYANFNARRIEDVLARMHPGVEWANGMEGGHVQGRDAVRDYWTRQWSVLDPHVEPLQINRDETGRYVVEVHQIVRNLEGTVLVDTIVHHAYRIRDGLIERMDIE
ncbi:MAG: nuclear transport factor 2 family protein [Acidobacteriota bacterium]|nr:nuclear transport factor 2 family protein [Acidobacteriota bacterium]